MLRITTAAVLFFATSTPRAAEPEGDLKAFQGTWIIEEATLEGRDHADDFKGLKLTITGEKYEIDFDKHSVNGTIKLDAAKKPKQIDLTTNKKGPFDGRDLPGIYELKDDKLVLCLAEKGDRPTKFESPEKKRDMLFVFKLAKK